MRKGETIIAYNRERNSNKSPKSVRRETSHQTQTVIKFRISNIEHYVKKKKSKFGAGALHGGSHSKWRLQKTSEQSGFIMSEKRLFMFFVLFWGLWRGRTAWQEEHGRAKLRISRLPGSTEERRNQGQKSTLNRHAFNDLLSSTVMLSVTHRHTPSHLLLP